QEASPAIVEPLRIDNPFLEEQFQEDPPKDPPKIPMANDRTMAELLRAPIEGYEDAIVILEIAANNFELRHAQIWLEKEAPRSILTWNDLVSKFINQFFLASKTINLRNEITRFQQRFDELFYKAWERFNDLLRACPHHGFSELHQLDTFYNALNSKSKVRQTRAKAVVAKVSTSSSTPAVSSKVVELKDMVRALLLDKKNQSSAPASSSTPAPVKAIKPNCVTCGGTHSYQNARYQRKRLSRQHPRVNQPPAYQALIPQTQSVSQTDFERYVKANDAVLRNIQSQGQRSGTLLGNTITNPKEDLKSITTRSGAAYQGPTISTPSKVVKQGTKVSELIVTPVSTPMPNLNPSIPYPSRRDNERRPLIGNKEKFSEMARTPINKHCSAVILNKLQRKFGDPGKFLIPCEFPGMDECLALTDLGASINLMSLSVWERLSLLELTPTCMTLELADRSVSKPIEVLGFSNVTASGNPTPYDDPIVSITSPTLTPFGDSDFLLFEEADAFLGLEDDPNSPEFNPSYYNLKGDILLLKAILNSKPLPPLPNHDQYFPSFKKELKVCEAKTVKSSVDEPPEVELKDLPPHLEYAFLEGDNKLPVNIAKELGDEEKFALIKVLKSHKGAIAWKLSDIHEVEKLLNAGLIYPISDSPWVSPVYCVPKKGGFTVVENEENGLIPTHLVTEWRVCIDYRKLNEATRKDHFPLPFVDQMLERLAGNEYYCFLDGFSGYFQIPIDPRDQEKTTFTCPYGTFAYRRMPFGLCNTPGTFQRCMLAIFHDMVEKTMEVFMDDFSVFRNSFENCLSRLDKMLQKCEDTNLSLNWEKSHFMVKEGIVLGHKISKNRIEVDKAKIDVIAKLPHPITIKVHTDHSALKYLFAKKDAKPRLLRWVLLPQEFDFKVFDTKGAENLEADHLSRLENPYENTLQITTQVEAKALPTNDARFVCKFLKSLFARFGSPRAIISDRGTHFCNDQFAKVMLKYGVTHRLSIAYHPQTSGQVVSNLGLKRILERTIGENRASWSDKLDDALWAFYITYKTPIGCTPYKLVYGKAFHLPIKLEHKAYWALNMQQTIPELTALCTSLQRQLSELIAKFQAQEVEINRLKDKLKLLEEREGVASTRPVDNAPIKGRTTVLASGVVDVPTGSGSILTVSTPAEVQVPTGSDVVPTASPIFATATMVTPYSRRKGKEVMVESATPKKQKVQEQIDAQVSRELEEQLERASEKSSVPLTIPDKPASPLRDGSQREAFPTDSGCIADQDRATIDNFQRKLSELTAKFQAQEVEINRLKERVKLLEDREGVAASRSRDDAPIKERSMDEGKASIKRISDDSEEMATVLTSMDAVTVLASGVVDVPTGSGSILTVSTPAEVQVPTGSDVVPTA
nr:reverse transcriptase domain-containing protein [Tanacetum cinerariifolium]